LASAAGRWVLLATVLGSAVAAIDATVVGIALPSIGAEFHTGLAAPRWVVTAYTFTLAGLLLVAGPWGPLWEAAPFILGIIWFAAASLLCGTAPNVPSLIAARAAGRG
jgi:MFS family permease